MTFVLFSIGITAAFFVASLALFNYGRSLGLRYLRKEGAGSIAGLATVEGAVFALIGLLVAFTVSGGLQRFDERRQLVVQEVAAVSTAYDRLGLFEGEVARNLKNKLKDYTYARIELYRMPHDYSLWEDEEVWSRTQQDKILDLQSKMWDATVSECRGLLEDTRRAGRSFANGWRKLAVLIRMANLTEPMTSQMVVENYNIMGSKVALESAVRHMAAGLGPKGTRVNAISPEPLATRVRFGDSVRCNP